MNDIIDAEKRQFLEEALEYYDIGSYEAALIRHNENMTFCITKARDNVKYLLRIHKSKQGFSANTMLGQVSSMEHRRSELRMLQCLKEHGVNVQSPIANMDGSLITKLKDGTLVTMLTWIEGDTLDKHELSPAIARRLGEMVAKMHLAVHGLPHMPAVSYDSELCDRLKERLKGVSNICEALPEGFMAQDDILQEGCAESGLLDDTMPNDMEMIPEALQEGTDIFDKGIPDCYYRILGKALDVIKLELEEKRGEFILTHSDLSPSNILVAGDEAVPIDFSLLGYCHPMIDLSGLFLCSKDPIHRRAMIEGYEAAGGKMDYHAFECITALDIILGIVLQCDIWVKEKWFAKRLPEWCKEFFLPLIKEDGVSITTLKEYCNP